MQRNFNFLLGLSIWGLFVFHAAAQCPPRPPSGTVVQDPFSLVSQNGVLSADLDMGYSVDQFGYTHYCYKYQSPTEVVEAPTLRVHQGDELLLKVKDSIPVNSSDSTSIMHMPAPTGQTCGDGGTATLQSTNVHFHGMKVSPSCHQDDVLTTLIQPGSPGFQYKIKIPDSQPPGLYWYHPHVHGFTEFQVNGGAAGALIVEGIDKLRPEVAGLTERVFVIRQQYLAPWIPGPYEITVNFHLAVPPESPSAPIIEMKPGERQFWRVANATLQEFMPLQVSVNGVAQPLELIALDGYPLAAPRTEQTILIPPAGRAEFIVEAPPAGSNAQFVEQSYSTGPTGNPDFEEILGNIQVSGTGAGDGRHAKPLPAPSSVSPEGVQLATLKDATPTTTRKLYFSEEFGGTNGPIQFYITVDGQKQRVFEPDEKPAITTKVGAVEDWTIENRTLETHAFHIHQIHFTMLEVDGKPVEQHDLRDTIQIPYWSGKGPYHSVKVRMDFRDPTIAGTFVFHCHILLHEDMGMMHKILVEP